MEEVRGSSPLPRTIHAAFGGRDSKGALFKNMKNVMFLGRMAELERSGSKVDGIVQTNFLKN